MDAGLAECLAALHENVEGGQRGAVDAGGEIRRKHGPEGQDEAYGLAGREILHGAQTDDLVERRARVAVIQDGVERGGEALTQDAARGIAERVARLAKHTRGPAGVGSQHGSQPLFENSPAIHYTQPVGLGSPASLHAPLAGPDGNIS